MAVNTSYPTGYLDPHCFKEISNLFYTYESPINYRTYDLRYTDKRWKCNCPDARYRQRHQEGRCKHEKALIALIMQAQTNGRSHIEIIAEQIAEKAQEHAEQSEIAALRAEVAQVRAELAEARAVQASASQMPDFSEILQKFAELQAENAEIKKVLATKATARKRTQTETEAAQVREIVNDVIDEAVEMMETTIVTAKRAKAELKSLETFPGLLKAEINQRLEADQLPTLEEDYQAPDHNAPEIKAEVRAMQEQERKRREATPEEHRKIAPLNGNQGFSFYR